MHGRVLFVCLRSLGAVHQFMHVGVFVKPCIFYPGCRPAMSRTEKKEKTEIPLPSLSPLRRPWPLPPFQRDILV